MNIAVKILLIAAGAGAVGYAAWSYNKYNNTITVYKWSPNQGAATVYFQGQTREVTPDDPWLINYKGLQYWVSSGQKLDGNYQLELMNFNKTGSSGLLIGETKMPTMG